MKVFEKLIGLAMQHKASDVHLRSGDVPCVRISGEMIPIKGNKLSKENLYSILNQFLKVEKSEGSAEDYTEKDGSYEVPGLCRLRYNFYVQMGEPAFVFRIINNQIPVWESLNISKTCIKIAEQRRGLILVTGATGSGKSTTLAAMIDHINNKRACHILTIEDPVEYQHSSKKARVSQREVGSDTPDFSTALRSALRQDPDVILIGELRDAITVQTALKAAETGHVVFSTVHTTDCLTSIGRIISMFPAEEQVEVRKRLADALYGTISQRMIKSATSKGVVIAQEIMVTNPGIHECILGKEPLGRIPEILETGHGPGGNGSQSFDQHLMMLYKAGKITKEVALENASNESDFIKELEFS